MSSISHAHVPEGGCIFDRIYIYAQSKYRVRVSILGPMTTSCALQAITACDLDPKTLSTVCSELIANWSDVLDYMTKLAPTLEMQQFRNKVSVLVNTRTKHLIFSSTRSDIEKRSKVVIFSDYQCFLLLQRQNFELTVILDEFFTVKLEFFSGLIRER